MCVAKIRTTSDPLSRFILLSCWCWRTINRFSVKAYDPNIDPDCGRQRAGAADDAERLRGPGDRLRVRRRGEGPTVLRGAATRLGVDGPDAERSGWVDGDAAD